MLRKRDKCCILYTKIFPIIYKLKKKNEIHLHEKNPAEIFTTIETDPITGEYYTIIPEWIMNDMNWYEGTELRFNIDTEEVIITEKND